LTAANILYRMLIIRASRKGMFGNANPDFRRRSARLMPASSIQFFFSGMGARSSSILERNSLRIGEVFDLL
jgi:hypothetical protein